MSEARQPNRGLDEWANTLVALGKPIEHTDQLAAQLRSDKAATVAMLTKLELPRFRSTTRTTPAFLAEPTAAFTGLKTAIFYASVDSTHDTTLRRQRMFGLDQAGTTEFVQKVAATSNGYDRIVLMESAPMQFGCNITVGPDDIVNTVYAELVDGTHSDLVGGKTPTMIGQRVTDGGARHGFFEYKRFSPESTYATANHTEEDIRRALFGAIMSIPNHVDQDEAEQYDPAFRNRALHFHPGYYELALVQAQPEAPLSPIFIEYSDQPAFVFNHYF
jgi:hypothetical protein